MRLILAALFIAMFAGCIQTTESFPTHSDDFIVSEDCFGVALMVAVDASNLDLPDVPLLPAADVFGNPTHDDVLLLMGVECAEWSEASSGIMLAGDAWAAYPLHQFGEAPYAQQRLDAGWIIGPGSARASNIPIGEIQYDVVSVSDDRGPWFDLSRTSSEQQDEPLSFTFERDGLSLTMAWEGNSALGYADCFFRNGGPEKQMLGLLDCDTHSTLALPLEGATIETRLAETI